MTKIGGVHTYSCYVPPSIPQVEYEDIFGQMLDENITVSSAANERANHLAEHISRACDGKFKDWITT